MQKIMSFLATSSFSSKLSFALLFLMGIFNMFTIMYATGPPYPGVGSCSSTDPSCYGTVGTNLCSTQQGTSCYAPPGGSGNAQNSCTSGFFCSVSVSGPAPPSGTPAENTIVCNIYLIYGTIKTAIFLIGITLMILGGALYAGSHIMPGSSKGNMQGYGMGMILGGVIGVIIAVIAPFVFNMIVGTNPLAANALNGTGNPGGC